VAVGYDLAGWPEVGASSGAEDVKLGDRIDESPAIALSVGMVVAWFAFVRAHAVLSDDSLVFVDE
jgi:hypothetical protein